MDDEELELPPWRTVTCTEPGCQNEGVAIVMRSAVNVTCGGGCQQLITSVVDVPVDDSPAA